MIILNISIINIGKPFLNISSILPQGNNIMFANYKFQGNNKDIRANKIHSNVKNANKMITLNISGSEGQISKLDPS